MASRGVNKVILIGNIGKDPELKYFPNGDAYCNLTLATSETWKDKASGELKEKTEWHNLVFSRKLAEIVGEYVRKGSKLYVEGSLRTRKWQDKEGNDRYTTEINVSEMQMLDGKVGRDGEARPEREAAQSRDPEVIKAQVAERQARAAESRQAAPQFEDDDIPFNF